MINLRKFIMVILLLSLLLVTFNVVSNATNFNINLSPEQNVTNEQNEINEVENTTTRNNTNNETSTNSSTNSVTNSAVGTSANTVLNTNTVANVQTVEQFEDNTSSFNASNVINILLLAVGLVIILLGVAILIRLKK